MRSRVKVRNMCREDQASVIFLSFSHTQNLAPFAAREIKGRVEKNPPILGKKNLFIAFTTNIYICKYVFSYRRPRVLRSVFCILVFVNAGCAIISPFLFGKLLL